MDTHERTETGYVWRRFQQIAEVAIVRREDLRGVWQVGDNLYSTIGEAREAAGRALTDAQGLHDGTEDDTPEAG